MIPASFSWSDLGSWETVHQLSDKDEAGNALQGQVLSLDSEGCLVQTGEKLTALLGVKDLVVIETEDALLIMDRSRAQEVGRITEALKKMKRDDLL
ncbi:MAG: mannose-1-phosphate guanylyltransferase/mannose-6-phosphate isomerase, partial [Deltaproteobacteria bacterium]|nr:mannose-1-phosphate guanylyltransferase/mannose-6-phosphate isomerase [Deltaproteobacteria bacterium]